MIESSVGRPAATDSATNSSMRSMPRVLVLVTAGSADAAAATSTGPVSPRSVPSSPCSSSTASRALDSIAESDAAAASGSFAITRRAAPACTPMTDTWCATTSCSSRAMRSRSIATACARVRSRSAASSAVRCSSSARDRAERYAESPKYQAPPKYSRFVSTLMRPEREVRRDDALAGEVGQLLGRHRADDQPPEQPHEHADDDDAAHDVRPQSVPAPRANRVDRDEQGDVREQRLADLGHRADDEGTGCHERHDLGPPPPRGERQVHRDDPEHRSPPRGALAPAGDAVEHDARGGARCEHERQHQVVAVGGARRARADPLDTLDGPGDELGHASTLATRRRPADPSRDGVRASFRPPHPTATLLAHDRLDVDRRAPPPPRRPTTPAARRTCACGTARSTGSSSSCSRCSPSRA